MALKCMVLYQRTMGKEKTKSLLIGSKTIYQTNGDYFLDTETSLKCQNHNWNRELEHKALSGSKVSVGHAVLHSSTAE